MLLAYYLKQCTFCMKVMQLRDLALLCINCSLIRLAQVRHILCVAYPKAASLNMLSIARMPNVRISVSI